MSIYYVYAYLRKDSTPYYIGKGKGYRITAGHNVRVPSDKSRIVKLHTNLTESEAHELEKHYIKQYGRKDIGTGILRNLTDGGEGASGAVRSAEFKEHLRSLRKGIPRDKDTIEKIKANAVGHPGSKNGMYGKTHHDSSLEVIRQKATGRKFSKEINLTKGHPGELNPRARAVVTPLGVFNTIKDAAASHNVHIDTITNRIKSTSEQFSGYRFK